MHVLKHCTYSSQCTQKLAIREDNNGNRHYEAGHHQEHGVACAVELLIVSVPVRSTGATQTFRDEPGKPKNNNVPILTH